MITKFDAIVSLRPHCGFELHEDGTINWWNTEHTCPTEAEINAELVRLQNEYQAKQYARDRALEYPDFKEYLDGIVKGDQAQIDKYIADCQAVKAKYPKPE